MSFSASDHQNHGAEQPSSLTEVRLLSAHAARLLAVADGLCAIGQLRTGERGGQFSIFNFLLRCAVDRAYPAPDDRPTHVLLMQAGIIRRHGWYAYFWLPDDERPLRLAVPSPISTAWHWHDDVVEISKRLERSDAWAQAVGESMEAHIERFAETLASAKVIRASTA